MCSRRPATPCAGRTAPAASTPRHLSFVTLDPAGSMDLDQAFALEADGDDVVLFYAIADVAAFVARGSPLDAEAWRRGVTIYAPDGRAPLHPTVLSEGAASLLPDVDRLAVLLTVAIDPKGEAMLRSAERAVVRSRAKLAYDTATDAELPDLMVEVAARGGAGRGPARRGAHRVPRPGDRRRPERAGWAHGAGRAQGPFGGLERRPVPVGQPGDRPAHARRRRRPVPGDERSPGRPARHAAPDRSGPRGSSGPRARTSAS